MDIVIHPRVKKYIEESGERERIISQLKMLSEDPINKRSGVDIKRLLGKKHEMFRLRIGAHRFEYFVEDDKIWVDEGFRRGRGYR